MAPAPKKLRAPQARAIAAADARYRKAKREADAARTDYYEIRARYADRVPVGQLVAAGGVEIKRRVQSSGPSFRIAEFLKGHKLTQAMKPFYSKGQPYEVWDVRLGE